MKNKERLYIHEPHPFPTDVQVDYLGPNGTKT